MLPPFGWPFSLNLVGPGLTMFKILNIFSPLLSWDSVGRQLGAKVRISSIRKWDPNWAFRVVETFYVPFPTLTIRNCCTATVDLTFSYSHPYSYWKHQETTRTGANHYHHQQQIRKDVPLHHFTSLPYTDTTLLYKPSSPHIPILMSKTTTDVPLLI